mgnify:CR=1 FL=1
MHIDTICVTYERWYDLYVHAFLQFLNNILSPHSLFEKRIWSFTPCIVETTYQVLELLFMWGMYVYNHVFHTIVKQLEKTIPNHTKYLIPIKIDLWRRRFVNIKKGNTVDSFS